jgi:hypothetical protein
LLGAFATVATGLAFQATEQFAFILVIAFVGTMNPSSGDIGLFVPLEHAMLAREAPDHDRTRTSYVMAVVTPPERPAAASVTAVPRSLASSISPALAGALLTSSFSGAPLVVCGVLKIVHDYDLSLLFSFRHTKPPEEQRAVELG